MIFNSESEQTLTQEALHSRCDYTLYDGMAVRGRPETVLRRGEILVEYREPVSSATPGEFWLVRQ